MGKNYGDSLAEFREAFIDLGQIIFKIFEPAIKLLTHLMIKGMRFVNRP